MTITDKIEPIHPGEVLMEDFIEGFGITQNRLAVSIGVPPRRINEIVHGKRSIIVFEGWDASGTGGAIQRLTAQWDPRLFSVWPIGAPP